jgi:hypothetical protein
MFGVRSVLVMLASSKLIEAFYHPNITICRSWIYHYLVRVGFIAMASSSSAAASAAIFQNCDDLIMIDGGLKFG